MSRDTVIFSESKARVDALRSGSVWQPGERAVAEEVPVAFTYDGTAHAVMMATPDNLRDFALGFSLTEGIIATAGEVEELTVQETPAGFNLQIWLREDRGEALLARCRHMADPVGCGMCGLESLAQVRRQVPQVGSGPLLTPAMIEAALASLWPVQRLHEEARAVACRRLLASWGRSVSAVG